MSLKNSISLCFAKRGVSLNIKVYFFAFFLQERWIFFVNIPKRDTHWIDFRGKGAVHTCAFTHTIRTLFL